MSKTIDVENGDWFTRDRDGDLWQYRPNWSRCIGPKSCGHGCDVGYSLAGEVVIGADDAREELRRWGYTITTPAESPAKPEPANVKQDLTVGVPVVDAVWVEEVGQLRGYSQWNKMNAVDGYAVAQGKARIVRLAPDADLAATVKRVEETVNLVREAATKNAMYCNELERRVAKLEAVIAEAQSLLNESPKAATTPAKVRVVLPEIPGWATDDRVTAGWNSCLVQVKLALSAAGIDVVKEAGK